MSGLDRDDICSWEWGRPGEETHRLLRRKVNDGDRERGVPLPPGSPLWKEHGKVQSVGRGIHIVICCCNEAEEELNVMLSTFRPDSPASCPVRASIIVDSSSQDPANDRQTYEVLKRKLRVTEDEATEVYEDFGCIMHSGTLDKSLLPFDLYAKGPSIPAGKRNSLVLFFDEILPAKISAGEAVEPDAVYLLDADSGHPVNGMQDLDSMWRLLMVEKETAAITCPVRPLNPFESFFAASQFLEYALVWDNVGESHFGLQTTCRGAQCMFKYRCLVEDGRLAQPPIGEGAMPPLLASFSLTAAGMPAMILLDTCPNEGLLVLLRQRGYDVRSCGVVDGVTCPPQSWLEFYAQRRRWYAGSLVAVASHLTGKECYFQMEWARWIICSYALVANVYLHCGLAFIPVLLAKGISRIIDYVSSRGATDTEQQQQEEVAADKTNLEWVMFALIWAFLVLNVAVYLARPHSRLWAWITLTSILWMGLCFAVLVGFGVAVSPYFPVVVAIVPLVLAGLSVSRGMLMTWCCLTLAAVPFVLLTAVNSVLVFLYAMATLDSTEWSTRHVGHFDSGVSDTRLVSMRRRKLCILFTVMASSCGAGILCMEFPAYTLIPVIAGLSVVSYILKLFFVIFPARLERSRQGRILGDAGHRPLSLRRNMAETAQFEDYVTESHEGLSRKGLGAKIQSDSGNYVTEDGTPYTGRLDTSTSTSFFASPSRDHVTGGSTEVPHANRQRGRRPGARAALESSGIQPAHPAVAGALSRSSPGDETSPPVPTGNGGQASRPVRPSSRVGGKRVNSRGEDNRLSAFRAEPQDVSNQGSTSTARPERSRRVPSARFLSGGGDGDVMVPSPTHPRLRRSDRERRSKVALRNVWGLSHKTSMSDESTSADQAEQEADQVYAGANPLASLSGWSEALPTEGLEASQPPKTRSEPRAKVTSTPQATVTSIATASRDQGGVKRYSWARRRSSISEFDGEASAIHRTPERPRGGLSASAGQSPLGGDKESERRSPATLNAILNSRIGATRRTDGVDEYAQRVVGSRRRPSAGGSLAGIRAAWGTSMGGSQDDIACPSPATINAIKNSRLGAVYSRGLAEIDEGSASEADSLDSSWRGPAMPSRQRRPMGVSSLAGIRATWGTSMGGSQDDIACPSPAIINAARNSRVGTTNFQVHIPIDDFSDSEAEDNVPVTAGGRRRPNGGGSLAGIRAAWGTSMGGSQDDISCPSPATINAKKNSRVGAVYSRGGDGGRRSAAGVRRKFGTLDVDNNGSFAVPLDEAETALALRKTPISGRREAGGRGGGSNARAEVLEYDLHRKGTGRNSERDKATGRAAPQNPVVARRTDKAATTAASTPGTRRSGAAGGCRASRGGTEGRTGATPTRRKWNVGQSGVFDSSGSSSDEEGARGLRGVQILDPEPPGSEVRNNGITRHTGGAARGRGDARVRDGTGGGGGRANGVASASLGPVAGMPVVGSLAGMITSGGPVAGGATALGWSGARGRGDTGGGPGRTIGAGNRAPRLSTMAGMPGFSQ